MKRIFLLLTIFVASSAFAQTHVSPYRPGVTAEGITYFLPQTGFHITLRATKKTYIPGEFYKYAQRYLRLNDVTTEQYDVWTLDEVKLEPFGVADTSSVYTIKLNPKSSAPLVTLTDDGRLLAVNKQVAQPLPFELPEAEQLVSAVYDADNYKTEEILAATSMMKMAELTAEEILDIRENRALLAKGQADFMPTDGEQLKLMLQSLDVQEHALMQCFKGTETSEQFVMAFGYIPTAEVTDHILFRFSKHKGCVDADDLAGEPYTITVENLHTLPAVQPADPNAKKGKAKEILDLRYIVPEKVKVTLSCNGKVLQSLTTPFAQFGRVEHLGGDLFNKKFTTRVTLSPLSGGVLSIEGEPVK